MAVTWKEIVIIAFYSHLLPLGILSSLSLCYFIIFYLPRIVGVPITIFYVIWYVYDFKRPFSGKIKIVPWLVHAHASMHEILCKYFSVKYYFVNEAAIRENKNKTILFGYHPHGLVSLGALIAFTSNSNICPHERAIYGTTLNVNFYIPFWREYLMAMGMCPVEKKSLLSLLNENLLKTVTIVIGGAREATFSHSDKLTKLILKNRKGFFQIAQQANCSVVPVFCFGETELYANKTINLPFIKMIQEKWLKTFGFALPNLRWTGMMPSQVPLNIVIGEPIDSQTPNLKELYIEQLQEMFEKYKSKISPLYNGILVID